MEFLPDKKKQIVQESEKVKKAKEKLLKQFELIEECTTKEALEQKSVEIHDWIARHAEHRVSLPNKSIALFDENQNAVESSLHLEKMAEKFQIDLEDLE